MGSGATWMRYSKIRVDAPPGDVVFVETLRIERESLQSLPPLPLALVTKSAAREASWIRGLRGELRKESQSELCQGRAE